MPRSVRRRSNKRVRVKRVNKNRSRRLGRRSSSKRVNRSRSRRRRRRTMRGGSESGSGSGLFGANKMDKDIKEHQKKAKEYEYKMAKQKEDFEKDQAQTSQGLHNIDEPSIDTPIDISSMSVKDRLKFFQGNTPTYHKEPETPPIPTEVQIGYQESVSEI